MTFSERHREGQRAMTILVVDDSASVRQQLRLALQQSGFAVLEANDGMQALHMLSREKVSLIVCDVNMPRLNGLQLLEQIGPRLLSLPVLMLTVENNSTLLAQARRAGAKGWIVKPFRAALLIKAIEKLLAR